MFIHHKHHTKLLTCNHNHTSISRHPPIIPNNLCYTGAKEVKMMPMNNQNLIHSTEDYTLFTKLYETYRNDMYQKAYAILKDSHLAEDAVQDAFIVIAQKFYKLHCRDISAKTRNYFCYIAKNKSIDIIRRLNLLDLLIMDRIDDIIVDSLHNTESTVLAREITTIFKQLPRHYQTILNLKYLYGFNNTEISELMNLHETNVKKLCYRAKCKLKHMLNH